MHLARRWWREFVVDASDVVELLRLALLLGKGSLDALDVLLGRARRRLGQVGRRQLPDAIGIFHLRRKRRGGGRYDGVAVVANEGRRGTDGKGGVERRGRRASRQVSSSPCHTRASTHLIVGASAEFVDVAQVVCPARLGAVAHAGRQIEAGIGLRVLVHDLIKLARIHEIALVKDGVDVLDYAW